MEQTFGSGQKKTENTKKRNKFFDFVEGHKKEIAIGAATICALVVVMIIFKNRTAINAMNNEEVVTEGLKPHGDAISVSSGVVEACHAWNPPSIKPTNVSEHLRNLPDGWKASQSKIDLAPRYGFFLGDHQTWVGSYVRTPA